MTNPKQTQSTFSYSVGMKVNVGNFQNVDIHISESKTFDVDGLSQEEIDAFVESSYNELRAELDDRLKIAVAEIS